MGKIFNDPFYFLFRSEIFHMEKKVFYDKYNGNEINFLDMYLNCSIKNLIDFHTSCNEEKNLIKQFIIYSKMKDSREKIKNKYSMVMNPNIITPKKYIEKIEKDKIYYEEIINSIEEENYRCHLYINELKKENNSFVNEIKIIKEVSNFHKKSKEKIEILIFELKKENEKKQKEIEKMRKMKKEKKDLEENFEKQREEKNRIEKDYIIQKRENNFLKKIDLENFELKKRNDFLEKKLLNKNLDKEESINKIYTNFR